MKIAKVHSVCECQGRLGAELDEGHQVLRGWARDVRGRTVGAPCTRAAYHDDTFHLVWLCPLCGRNTLRSFEKGGLMYEEAAPATSEAPPAP